MRLPLELCEAILDQIPEDDWDTLHNCALVCHFFAVRSQRILFRKISLGRPVKAFQSNVLSLRQPSRRFLSLISGSPHLIPYVEEIEITDSAHIHFYREELSWIRQDTTLPAILFRLENVQRIGIIGNAAGTRLNFRAWSEDLKHTIQMKCQSPLLTKISLSFVRNIPVSVLVQAPALEALHLLKSVFIVDAPLSPAQRSIKPKLKTLDVVTTTYHEWSSFYPWIVDKDSSLDLSNLHALALHIDTSYPIEDSVTFVNTTAWIIRQCSQTLRHLRLFYPPEASSSLIAPLDFLDLQTMPNLCSLYLHGAIWTDLLPNVPPDRMPWLLAVLRPLFSSTGTFHPALQEISLLCIVEQENAGEDVSEAAWSGFVNVVERLAEHVKIAVLVSLFEPWVPTTQAVVEARLRVLRERGIAQVRKVSDDEMSALVPL